MGKRRKKKDFRPRRANAEQTPEPVTVSADPHVEEPAIEAASDAPIEAPITAVETVAEETSAGDSIADEPIEEPRRRTDSLEPVAFLATREAAYAEMLANEEAIAQDAPRPPSRFLPIVQTVVAACAVIALAGGARAGLKHVRASHAHATESTAVASPPRPDVMPTEEESAPAEATPSPEPDVDLYDPALAVTLAERSRMKLEHRDVLDAIELGEQAVSHDAKNARAWVILGAAYQQHGDMTSARNAYRMCVDGAQVAGDKSREDCAAMLQK